MSETLGRGLTDVGVDFVTKDSGKRQEYSSGMNRDTQDGKPRFGLIMPNDIPFQAQSLTRWAKLMTRGAVKYGERNWEKADSIEEFERFRESAYRHFVQWYCGEYDEDHMAAVMFNLSASEYVRYKLWKRDKGHGEPCSRDNEGLASPAQTVPAPQEES